MIPKNDLDLKYIQRALHRRFWHIVLPFFLVSLASVGYSIKAPRVYQSSTLILVQPQEVPPDYVRPTVTTDARSRLNTLREQVMSRPRLEKIIDEFGLYPEVRAKFTMYDAVETMREDITLTVKQTERRRDMAPASFEVSYQGHDPVKVREVTAAIANLFIQDDLKLRETQAAGTSQFLERELQRMKEELRKKEELVRQFKEEHMGQLPEQMENNYRILAQLQQQQDTINASLQQTEDRRVLLRTQLGTLETVQAGARESELQGIDSGPGERQVNLEGLREQLDSLRSRYSDKHPDVARVLAAIEKLEKEQGAHEADAGSDASGMTPPTTKAEQMIQVQRDDVLVQMSLIDRQISTLMEEKRKMGAQIQEYRKRIENGPKIEQMFVDLRRGYQEANESYQSLLEKKLQAELAENLERTQKGEQFVILEPALVPQKPFKPDVPKLLAIGLLLALASGFGLAFLLEYLDPTFRRSKDLESLMKFPVLVSIPIVNTPGECRRSTIKKMGTAGAVVTMTSVLLYAFFILWKMDPTAFLWAGLN